MGAEQSQNQSQKPEEPKLSQREVQNLLNAQRLMYEKKCQEYIEKTKADTAAPAPAPQPSYVQQPLYVPQPPHMQNAAHMQQVPHMQQAPMMPQTAYHPQFPSQSAGLERQRAPYSYARDDLQNINRQSTPTPPNLYPNLSANTANPGAGQVHSFNFDNHNQNPAQGFVFVNRNGQADRAQPSAPVLPRTGRDRSASRTRNNNNNANSELNCPTCKTMFGLQIYQCSSGHSSCKTCKEYHRQCGICGNDITNMRNHALEGYMAEKKVPCPHKDDGCMLVIKMADIEFHVKECPFKELQCPLGCSWKGKLKQLSGHFDAMHPEQRTADVDTELRIQDISRNSQKVFLVIIGAFNFLFHVKVSEPDNRIYMTTQLIGTKISASKWAYEVHVYNKNESRRKYTFSDACNSFVEPVADIFKEGRCSILPQSYANTFMHNGNLTYKFFIKQTVANKPRGEFKNQRGKGRN